MPAKSKSQQRLMAAALHGSTFKKAREIRASMSNEQIHDFAWGTMKGKPEHSKKKKD